MWDTGYPSGGNYWDDYDGTDQYRGPYQNVTGTDGIGDTPYTIDMNNIDRYPLISPNMPSHDVAVTNVKPLKTVIGQGCCMNISVTIANYGTFDEEFNLSVFANSTLINQTAIALTASNITVVVFPCNTSGFFHGNYALWAYAEPIPSETNTANNNCTGDKAIVTILGDVDGNLKIDMGDIVIILDAFGSRKGQSQYNANCDFDDNNQVDMGDVVTALDHFGQHYQQHSG
jgi:hypothetical protein